MLEFADLSHHASFFVMMVIVTEPESASRTEEEPEPMLYCPVCSTRLESRKCKLFCAQCGYYMSCADYY
jgi:hypothetical protein